MWKRFGSKLTRRPSGRSSSQKYISRKELGEEGLEKILFDGDEGKAILRKMGLVPSSLENKVWRWPVDVVDDDKKKKYELELKQEEKFGPFGFHKDWEEQVVSDREFKESDVVGFYVKNGDIHFSLLNGTAGNGDEDDE